MTSADVVVVVNDNESPWDDGSRFGDRALVILKDMNAPLREQARLSRQGWTAALLTGESP